jgi:hypothetical protein
MRSNSFVPAAHGSLKSAEQFYREARDWVVHFDHFNEQIDALRSYHGANAAHRGGDLYWIC